MKNNLFYSLSAFFGFCAFTLSIFIDNVANNFFEEFLGILICALSMILFFVSIFCLIENKRSF